MDINQKITALDMKTKLSTLWIFVLLNVIFRDIHEIVKPAFLAEMMSGNGSQPSEELFLIAGILLEISIGMVLLSRVLTYRLNRWANIIAGALTMGFILFNISTPDLDDIFFAAVEVVGLSLIIWLAWKWPTPEHSPLSETNQLKNLHEISGK